MLLDFGGWGGLVAELEVLLEAQADQVGSAEVVLLDFGGWGGLEAELEVLLEAQADQVGSAEVVVVVHPFHALSAAEEEATAEAEAAPTMAAAAMTDFILMVGVGTRKSDCGQILL